MSSENQDAKFIAKIIDQIARYAKANQMSVDDTIKTIGKWLINLTKISTFEGYKVDDKEAKDGF